MPPSSDTVTESSPLLSPDDPHSTEPYKGVTMLQAFSYCLPFVLPTSAIGFFECIAIILTNVGSKAYGFVTGYFIKISLDGLTSPGKFSSEHAIRNAVFYLCATAFTSILGRVTSVLESHYDQSIEQRFDVHSFNRLMHYPFFNNELIGMTEYQKALEKNKKKLNKNSKDDAKIEGEDHDHSDCDDNDCDDDDSSSTSSSSSDTKHMSSGKMLSIFFRGTGSLQALTGTILFNIVPTLFEVIFVIYIFFIFDISSIALVTFITVVIFSLAQAYIVKQERKLTDSMIDTMIEENVHLNERLRSAANVCAHATSGKEGVRHDILLTDRLKSEFRRQYFTTMSGTVSSLILDIGKTICLLLAGYQASKGTLSAGDFSLVVTFLSSLFGPMISLTRSVTSLVTTVTHIKRLIDVISLVDQPQEKMTDFDEEHIKNVVRDREMKAKVEDEKKRLAKDKKTSQEDDHHGRHEANDEQSFDDHRLMSSHPSEVLNEGEVSNQNDISNDIILNYSDLKHEVGIEFRHVSFSYNTRNGKSRTTTDSNSAGTKETASNNDSALDTESSVSIEISPDTSKPKPKKEDKQFFEGVHDLSFVSAPGRPIAFVGMSGSGKSTVLSLISGLQKPQAGEIILNGNTVPNSLSVYDRLEQNKLIGSVLQDTSIFSGTVRENVLYINHASARYDRDDSNVWHALECVGLDSKVQSMKKKLDTNVEEDGSRLSGGERQRLAISRVFAAEFDIVVTDEATAALSALDEAKVMKSLRAISERSALVLVAHRLKTITFASEIIVLQNGKVAERGTHQSLLKDKGIYSKMWTEQMQVSDSNSESQSDSGASGK